MSQSIIVENNRRQWLYIGLATFVGVALLAYKLYTSLLPKSAEYLAAQIPQEIYQQIGESSLEGLDESEFLTTELDETNQARITEQFHQLLAELKLEQEDYPLHFRAWEPGMNAFALMDGSVILTDALAEKLEDPKQLNAVLLHEVGHVKHNHMMEHAIQMSLTYIGLSLMFGDVSVVADIAVEASTMGVNAGFSQAFEIEADAWAAKQMLKLYGDTEAMEQALQAIHDSHDASENSWLSTHPSLAERLAVVRAVEKNSH